MANGGMAPSFALNPPVRSTPLSGTTNQLIGAVGMAASSFIATWGAYSSAKTAAKSANDLAKIQAKSRSELAAIQNVRVDIQTDLDLYFQAEQFEDARRSVINKNLEVQTAVLRAKGNASAKAAFTGVHGATEEVTNNLIDIQGAGAKRDVEATMQSLQRQNALAVGNTLLKNSASKQQTSFTPLSVQSPSSGLAIGGAVADASRIARELYKQK